MKHDLLFLFFLSYLRNSGFNAHTTCEDRTEKIYNKNTRALEIELRNKVSEHSKSRSSKLVH